MERTRRTKPATERAIAGAVAVALLASSSGCHASANGPAAQATTAAAAQAGPPESAAPGWPTTPPTDAPNTNPPMDPDLAAAFSPQAEAGATVGQVVDPRSFTATELRFGRPPKLGREVTYQPGVLVMEHGDTALRSMESNGIVWHFSANAPQVDQIASGKIIFATERCVGRAAAVRRTGDDVAVVLEPVQITDIIQQGHFVYNGPLDASKLVVAPAPDLPVQFTQDVIPSSPSSSPGVAPTVSPSSVPSASVTTQHLRLASVTYAVVAENGTWKPFRVATYDRRGRVTQRFLQLADDRVAQAGPASGPMGGMPASQPNGVPAPPATIGEPEQRWVDVDGMDALPCIIGCGGIGVQLKYSRNGLNVYANAVFFIKRPNVSFDVDIGLSGIKTAAMYINGAAGFTTRFEATADQAFAGNIHILKPIPLDATLPLNFIAPIGVHVMEELALSTGFSARTSVLTGGVTFQACCQFAVGYIKGKWKADYPKIDVLTPSSNVSGISVGINSLVFGFSQQLLVGLGFAGFSTGPYMSISETMTALKQSSAVLADCRQATLAMQLNAGVGYTLPSALTKVVNVFLNLANAEPLSQHGSLLTMPPATVLQYTGSLPKGCAGSGGGTQ